MPSHSVVCLRHVYPVIIVSPVHISSVCNMQRRGYTVVFADYTVSRTGGISTDLLRGDLLFRLCGSWRYWGLFHGDFCIATNLLVIWLMSQEFG